MEMSELPKDCETYITNILGRKMSEVIAHRIVNADEVRYAVLMGDEKTRAHMFTVVFVAQYTARRPLYNYEEPFEANAALTGWECIWDGEPWNFTVERFRNAPASFFEGC